MSDINNNLSEKIKKKKKTISLKTTHPPKSTILVTVF